MGVATVFLSLMMLGGLAFISDHRVVTHQRDILKQSVVAASIAATAKMGQLDGNLTDEELTAALAPITRRYILANIPQERRDRARDTLEVTVMPDRAAGVVSVAARADLGGAVVGRYLWGKLVDEVNAQSGVERVLAPVSVVLAIDVTGSMQGSIRHQAGDSFPEEDRRINVVRTAAQALIGGLYDQAGETGYVSVGVVPFTTTVNVGTHRTEWMSDLGRGHKAIPPGFGPWQGCIEHRVGAGDPDLSLETPGEAPFTSWFNPSTLEFRPGERARLLTWIVEGFGGDRVVGENDWDAANPHTDYEHSPHYACPRNPILPLTSEVRMVERAIETLQPWPGGGTMTHLGMVWGRRLLAPEWRDAWGFPEPPEGEPPRKHVLVLLTDGVNEVWDGRRTYPGRYFHGEALLNTEFISGYTGYGRIGGGGTAEEGYRTGTRFEGRSNARRILDETLLEACELAKLDGITVFAVSAVPHGHPREEQLRDRLLACANSDQHVFADHSDPARMVAAFQQIGEMVQGIRRIQ